MSSDVADNLKRYIRRLERREIKENSFSMDKEYKIDYSKVLSWEQQKALQCIRGQYLVIAGAGSGKTRTMVYRTAFLMENGVPPEKIVMITFTRKAADEMNTRLNSIVRSKDTGVKIMTFHSLCARLLYRNKALLGISEINILEEEKKEKVIEKIFDRENLGDAKISITDVVEYINKKGIDSSYLPGSSQEHIADRIYDKYIKVKEKENYFEFDDLIRKINELFSRNKNFLEYVQKKISYLIVDEYQDSNEEQRKLLKFIVGKNKNLMVVGDDFQSIYGFRGADFTNILKFGEDFPNSKLIKLQTNYRSKDEIIRYTNRIAKAMSIKYSKKIFGTGKKGGKIYTNQFINEDKQWEYICKKIKKLRETDIPYNEMAVLYRNRYLICQFEKYLEKEGIPYSIKENENRDAISLLSVHSSKGLEWEAVFLPCLLEGIFPCANTQKELEEEKRLYYVGCSRAKTFLYLLYPKFFYEKIGYYEKKSSFLKL